LFIIKMSNDIQSPMRKKPLYGVVIFVSQKLVTNRMALHKLCTILGGKFVWAFDIPFTHYICQGKLSKRGKEYKKVEEYRAICVHPAWLKACQNVGQRVAEKLYASTYNPNRSLTFVSVEDDEENIDIQSTPSLIPIQTSRIIPITMKKSKINPDISFSTIRSTTESLSKIIPSSSEQTTDEAETMLNDLESSLAQFLNKNNIISCPSSTLIIDDDQKKKSLPLVRSISNISNYTKEEPLIPQISMRVEWLDDAMQAERKKMIDEEESNEFSQQQHYQGSSITTQKRRFIESDESQTSTISFNVKKFRT